MTAEKWIFFDCMETLVDLVELPRAEDYGLWAYDGSGLEGLWGSPEKYLEFYMQARKLLLLRYPEHKEYDIYERYELCISLSFPRMSRDEVSSAARKLYGCFWKNYSGRCYAADDVKHAVLMLSQHYSLGVVSNFMVLGGIEKLLELTGLLKYFKFTVTSVAEGWRKPHEAIYKTALEKAGSQPQNILFVGDDYINDYKAPAAFGINTVLLDRFCKYKDTAPRIRSFDELTPCLVEQLYENKQEKARY